MPSLFIPFAAMGKCKQINNSKLSYVSDVISLIIHERNYDFIHAVFLTLSHQTTVLNCTLVGLTTMSLLQMKAVGLAFHLGPILNVLLLVNFIIHVDPSPPMLRIICSKDKVSKSASYGSAVTASAAAQHKQCNVMYHVTDNIKRHEGIQIPVRISRALHS